MDTFSILLAQKVGGGIGKGAEYTSIVYNDDGTITLTDTRGISHTIICTYEDEKITSITYDEKIIDLTYNGDTLVSIGETAIDIANIPTAVSIDENGIVNLDGSIDDQGIVTV